MVMMKTVSLNSVGDSQILQGSPLKGAQFGDMTPCKCQHFVGTHYVNFQERLGNFHSLRLAHRDGSTTYIISDINGRDGTAALFCSAICTAKHVVIIPSARWFQQ